MIEIRVTILFFILFFSKMISASQVFQTGEAFGVYIENDSRNIGGPGSDQSYTNGIKFSYIYAENKIPRWSESVVQEIQNFDSQLKDSKINFGYSIGQQIYTPNNTSLEDLDQNDRPYAGWLYFGFAVSLKEKDEMHFIEIDTGYVGPSALAKQTQNNFHDLIHTKKAQGWENTLHDEFTLQTFYQKKFKIVLNQFFDFYPYYGVSLGQIKIATHVGGLIRFGFNLPNDFGPSRPSASDGDSFITPMKHSYRDLNSYYLFAGSRGNAFLRNIFLDGNSFQESPHVTKYPLNAETEFGIGVQSFPYSFVWRFVTKSPEFKERSRFASFASFNLFYVYDSQRE